MPVLKLLLAQLRWALCLQTRFLWPYVIGQRVDRDRNNKAVSIMKFEKQKPVQRKNQLWREALSSVNKETVHF